MLMTNGAVMTHLVARFPVSTFSVELMLESFQ